VRDALAEEAGDVFVVEIEPGPAGVSGEADACGHGDGWVTQGGEDVPRSGDDGEDEDCCWDLEFEEEFELAGAGEVEQSEKDREDDADEALGEDTEG